MDMIVKLFVTSKKLETLLNGEATNHVINDRMERLELAMKQVSNDMVDQVFLVDRFHRNGKEIFFVLKNGVIFIFNQNSLKLITILFPRPNQVKRLYRDCGLCPSKSLLDICEKNKTNKLNTL